MADKDDDKLTLEVLAQLFPKKEIPIRDTGKFIVMVPLSVEDITSVIKSFQVLMKLRQSGEGASDIAISAITEFSKLIPLCTTPKLTLKQIPVPMVPELVEAFLDLNMNNEVVGKWTALIQTVMVGLVEGTKVVNEAKNVTRKTMLNQGLDGGLPKQ